MTHEIPGPVISLMLAVPDATAAARGYTQALGATELGNLGGVVGLTIEGAPFFRRTRNEQPRGHSEAIVVTRQRNGRPARANYANEGAASAPAGSGIIRLRRRTLRPGPP
jgi:hypothetical protein